MKAGTIRTGIGGWDYDPWRETFYPPKWPKARQLDYASRQLAAIEINATYYKLQTPQLFARWRDTVPDGFRFAIKASRYCTNRKSLADGGEAIARFHAQGLSELGERLGPILWQFMATKRFDPVDMQGFLDLLPRELDGRPLVHVLEPRHESFRDPAFIAMARAAGVGIVLGEADDFPCIADASGPVVYARLQRCRAEEAAGYPAADLDLWAARARTWATGGTPDGLDLVAPPAPAAPRDVYIVFIAGAKERAPAAAMALAERLR